MKTFCIVLAQPLVVARCPLPAKSCTWQHRTTNFCKYGGEVSPEEHAQRVGLPAPTSRELQEMETQLIEGIRAQV